MNSDGEDRPYQKVFESLHDGIVITDLQSGLVVAANPAAATLHGYDRAELAGLPHTDLLHPVSRSLFAGWVAAARAGKPIVAAAVHVRRDGIPFTVEVRAGLCEWGGAECLLAVLREAGEPGAMIRQAAAQAALEERKRLAQNLHDAVNQSLFSASLIAEVLPRLWQHHPEDVLESLEDLRRLTRGALAEMRGLLVELQPLVLTDTELEDLLRLLGDALTGRTNIPVTVTVTGEGALPAEAQVAFYRVCQEALNNIAKHSWAGQVAIDLTYDGASVELRIRDDGRGFDPEQIPSNHYGLSIMRERAETAGATLSITSRPGEGTEITVRRQQLPTQEEL